MMLNLLCRFVLWFLFVGGCYLPSSHALEQDHYFLSRKALVEKLTNDSSITKMILPIIDVNKPVKLEVEIALRQISSLDEVNQVVRLNVWFRLYWHNPFLHWDINDHGGIASAHLDSELFWTPDIALYNQASLEEDIDILYKRFGTNIIIDHDGNCTWLAPIALQAQCRVDVSSFPFDRQDCPVTIGSWTHTKYEIDIRNRADHAELDNFIPNGEWEVLSANLMANTKYYGLNKVPYPDVTMELRVKRKALYYGFNLIIPCGLIAMLSFGSFLLPSNHGERTSLVITVLLANTVYMLMVSSALPQTSDTVPVIVVYFLSVIIMIALCLFATCLTVTICENQTEMPEWVETIVNKHLARLVFIAPEESTTHDRDNGIRDIAENERPRKLSDRERSVSEKKKKGLDSSSQPDAELIEIGFSKQACDWEATSDEAIQNPFLGEILYLSNQVRAKQALEFLGKKWKRAARVLDRMFLFFFIIAYIVLTSYLLASM